MTTTSSPFLTRRLLGCGAFLVATAVMAQASVIYETGFNGAAQPFESAPGYQDQWFVHRSDTAISTTLSLNGDGLLEVVNPADATASSQFGGAIYTGKTNLANGSVSGVFQYVANANQSSGLFARIQNPTADGSRPKGYFAGILRYNPGSGNATYLVIAKDIEFSNVSGYLLVSTPISVSSMNFYQLDFGFEGDSLTATLYNAAGDLQIASLSTTDTAYSIGAVGLRANFGVKDRLIGFDSFRVTEQIPEPSTALFLFPAGFLAFRFLRRTSRL